MCQPANWKREVVPDHKFDFIDTRDYHDNGFGTRFKYFWLYILILKTFLVYVADIYTGVTMATSAGWSNAIFSSQCTFGSGDCFIIPFEVGKWLFIGSIIFSFLLLAYEARKSKKIIASRDISFAFTNPMANSYYSLRSYDHFCFFCNIENSTKKKDDFAFFIFFTFKEWKRLLLADGPRAVINGMTLTSFILAKMKANPTRGWWEVEIYFGKDVTADITTNLMLGTMIFTVLIFAGSLILLIFAGVFYIPLLCYIQGNLKEYCVHKVDKRIDELVKRKHKQRMAKQNAIARKEAAGDFSHKGKGGDALGDGLPQPTLPNLSVDDDDDKSIRPLRAPMAPSLHYAASVNTDYYDKSSEYGGDYPPMPGYDQYPPHGGEYQTDPYNNEYLAHSPAYSQQAYNMGQHQQGGYIADPRDVYMGGDQYHTEQGYHNQGTPIPRQDYPNGDPQDGARRRSSGLAYDDEPEPAGVPPRYTTPVQPPSRQGTPGYGYQQPPPARQGTPGYGQPPSRHGTPAQQGWQGPGY